MRRRVRLALWVVAATGALAWPVFVPELVWVQIVFLVSLAVLWWAAPSDSIRMPFAASAVLIVGGVVLLQFVAMSRGVTTILPSIILVLLSISLVIEMRTSDETVWGITPLVWAWWTMQGWIGVISMIVLGPVIVGLASRRARAAKTSR